MATYPTTGSTPWGPSLQAYIDGGVASAAAGGSRKLIPTSSPFNQSATLRLSNANATHVVIGIDTVSNSVYTQDTTNGKIKQSDDWYATATNKTTLPTNVTYANVARILRFGSTLYMLAKDTTTALWGIYSTAPVAQASDWGAWTGPLKTLSAGMLTAKPTHLEASSWGTGTNYLYATEYDDPSGGPQIYRSSDGTTWTTVFGPDASLRHGHHVMPDPYNPGHVWATMGDGTSKTIMRSTDSGATWTTAVASSAWQGVQISFSQQWVFIAGDSMRSTVTVVDRATNTPYAASTNYHQHIAVPVPNSAPRTVTDLVTTSGSATVTSATAAFTAADRGKRLQLPSGNRLAQGLYITSVNSATSVTLSDGSGGGQANASGTALTAVIGGDQFFANCYFGAVDPATGIYYCVANDASNAGTTQGLFCLPSVGGRIELLDGGGIGINMNNYVWIAGGYVWTGQWKRPLLNVVPVTV